VASLAAQVSPAEAHVVAILKAYLDDSGDADSARETHLTIGGYVSDEEGWRWFEPQWQALLDDAGVPYLHMAEFGDPKSPIYGHLKADSEKERLFMEAVTEIIKDAARGSIATTVVLDDFREFNKAHGLRLDPYAFAVYGCMFQLRSYYPDSPIDIIFDKFDNSISRVAKAFDYARTDDICDRIKPNMFTPIPLQEEESWRDILPLQAADLMAWEVRKYRRERASLRPPFELRDDREAIAQWISAWESTLERKPRDRLSFQSLRRGMIFRPLHVVVDQYSLEDVLARHPNGWGA
jgi:hypothetical protein